MKKIILNSIYTALAVWIILGGVVLNFKRNDTLLLWYTATTIGLGVYQLLSIDLEAV